MTEPRLRLAPATGLQSLPPPPARIPTPPHATPAATSPPEQAEAGEKPPTRPTSARPRRGGGAAKESERAVVIRDLSFTTTVSVRAALRSAARDRDTTQLLVLVQALEATEDRLTDLVNAEANRERTTSSTRFGITDGRRRHTEDRVPVALRAPSTFVDELDRLTEHHAATDRSQLITAALRHALTSPD